MCCSIQCHLLHLTRSTPAWFSVSLKSFYSGHTWLLHTCLTTAWWAILSKLTLFTHESKMHIKQYTFHALPFFYSITASLLPSTPTCFSVPAPPIPHLPFSSPCPALPSSLFCSSSPPPPVDINAQARKLQRNRAKGTLTLPRSTNSSLCRSLSETSLNQVGRWCLVRMIIIIIIITSSKDVLFSVMFVCTDVSETAWAGWTWSREEPIKILDFWRPPLERPDVGAVITTYTFGPVTFEVIESKNIFPGFLGSICIPFAPN